MADLEHDLRTLAARCRDASRVIAQTSTATKNAVLESMAAALLDSRESILAANRVDLDKARDKGISGALLDRLELTAERVASMAQALQDTAQLPDPVGRLSAMERRPSGIQVGTMRIPLGVIMMIYEARPNVTSDAAGLCLKAGNAVILRGGSEAFESNTTIVKILHAALTEHGLPPEVLTFVPTSDRKAMVTLMQMSDLIDLVIPRGGEGLIRFVDENSRIPVIKHYKGVCHLYVDQRSDTDMALRILIDGKTSRPGVCNALETMLVHADRAAQFLPEAARELSRRKVELRGCPLTRQILPDITAATDMDYAAEFLDLILAVKVVENLDEAVSHIARFGSDHTEVIVTDDYASSRRFLEQVNSSVVLVNASSRFSDGGELGLGAEIGISTSRLHAYGPMGLEALTTKKFVVLGAGETRHPV